MTSLRIGSARARHALGRSLCIAAAVLCAACQSVGGAEETPRPAPLPEPVIERGNVSPAAEARAAQLYARADEALSAGRPEEARRLARVIVDEVPQAPVSGRALLLLARASLELEAYADADTAAGRYVGLLPPGDSRTPQVLLLQSRARAGLGDHVGRLSLLLGLDGSLETATLLSAEAEAREAAALVTRSSLENLVRETPAGRTLLPVVLARYAAVLQAAGEDGAAVEVARAAWEAGVRGTDSLSVEAILDGRPALEAPGAIAGGRMRVASVLPTGGSPAFQDFAKLVLEGIEVAAATYLGDEAVVEVDSRDDQGDPALAAAIVQELEREDVLGAVGFLEEGALDAAGDARRGVLPLVSPTARTAFGEGVYSMSGADPRAAVAIAEYAARTGYLRVAIIHSQAPESLEEADAFQAAMARLGVPVVGRFAYEYGATYFAPQIRNSQEALRGAEIRALNLGEEDTLHVELLDPVAIFLPVPPEDVELLAPQVTHFGLDTLGIQTLGTSGWTDPQTLAVVDTRHTTGVVATAPVGAGEGSAGYGRFREAYEAHFQRTLVSPLPAYGYDAALLLLEGARRGARSPRQLEAAMQGIRDLEGANGIYSVIGGRVLRKTEIVRLESGAFIPIG